jgi:hypothetical protein
MLQQKSSVSTGTQRGNKLNDKYTVTYHKIFDVILKRKGQLTNVSPLQNPFPL